MNKIHFLLIYFISIFCFAQAPNIQWQKTLGGQNRDILKSLIERNGNYYFAGFSNSPVSGDKTTVNGASDTNDIWALSLDSSGTIFWQNSYFHSNPNNLLADNKASLHFFDNHFFFSVTYDDFDVWMSRVHKFNDIGASHAIISPGKDEVCLGLISSNYDVVTTDYFKTSDGGYIYSGTNGFLATFCTGSSNYFISKSNSTNYNDVAWSTKFGANNYEELTATIETNDGGFLLTGKSNSNISGDKTENSNGGFDYWIIKTNSAGSIVWQNTIGGNLADEPIDAIQTTDGGFMILGSSKSTISGDKTENSNGGFDFWILKLDPNGIVLWDKTIGGDLDDVASKIITTSDGGFILLGSSKSNIYEDKTQANRGGFDIWMVKINSLGTVIWDKTIGGNLDDIAYDIIPTSDSGFMVAATSSSSISGEKNENSRGDKDYWILKLESNLSVSENEFLNQITVFPNPTNSTINVNFGIPTDGISVSVITVLGQLISKTDCSLVSFKEIDIKGESGIYFVEIEGASRQKKVFKIIKK